MRPFKPASSLIEARRRELLSLFAGPLFAVSISLLLGLAGCTSKPTGYSDFDVDTDFSQFQSFTWLPDKALFVASPDPVNPALEDTLKEAVRDNLAKRGYRFTANAEEADMMIGFTVGVSPTLRTTTFISSYRQGQIIGAGIDSIDTQVVNQESTEGGIVIDIYDRSSGVKKWMGWTVTEITRSDQINLQPAVRELVGIVLRHFPPDA
jgi:hypothetical protein